jgi:putative transposase
MPNTYTQLHVHFVFVVKYRERVILDSWKAELYKYITGIIQNNAHKMLIINGVEDHVHMLVGIRPSQSISDLMKDVKANSSRWINEQRLVKGKFEWQEGYAAFSYSTSQLSNVIAYIAKQEEHHRKHKFRDEYLNLLKQFDIDYDERYLFHEPL